MIEKHPAKGNPFKLAYYRECCSEKLIKGKIIVAMVIVIGLLLPVVSVAGEGQKVGEKAPFFKVESGGGETLTLDMIRGKVLIVFYETKEVKEKNRKAKDELNTFYAQQVNWVKELVVRLPVINCSSAGWPFTGIWKSKLKKNSEKEGMTIYGDWDGKMYSDYRMKDNESNVMLIDKKGMLRYFTSGMINGKDIGKIKDILKELVLEEF